MHPDEALVIDSLRQFMKLHATCGSVAIDTPPAPVGGYRALAACRCGDTVEYWMPAALLLPHQLVDALARPSASGVRPRAA